MMLSCKAAAYIEPTTSACLPAIHHVQATLGIVREQTMVFGDSSTTWR